MSERKPNALCPDRANRIPLLASTSSERRHLVRSFFVLLNARGKNALMRLIEGSILRKFTDFKNSIIEVSLTPNH